MAETTMATPAIEARAQVERIPGSKTFEASEVLRDLFAYLAEKALAGESDNLKEYTIGLDALGKPASSYALHRDIAPDRQPACELSCSRVSIIKRASLGVKAQLFRFHLLQWLKVLLMRIGLATALASCRHEHAGESGHLQSDSRNSKGGREKREHPCPRRPAFRLPWLLLRPDGEGVPSLPLDEFKAQWKDRGIRRRFHLTVSGCLGPCTLANVVMIQFKRRMRISSQRTTKMH